MWRPRVLPTVKQIPLGDHQRLIVLIQCTKRPEQVPRTHRSFWITFAAWRALRWQDLFQQSSRIGRGHIPSRRAPGKISYGHRGAVRCSSNTFLHRVTRSFRALRLRCAPGRCCFAIYQAVEVSPCLAQSDSPSVRVGYRRAGRSSTPQRHRLEASTLLPAEVVGLQLKVAGCSAPRVSERRDCTFSLKASASLQISEPP